MFTLKRLILGLLLAAAAVTAVEAGLFRNRYGEVRRPIRNFIANRLEARAERVESRSGACASCGANCSTAACATNACVGAECDDVAAKAFANANVEEEGFAGAAPEAGRVFPGLAEREKRLGVRERAVFEVLKHRPDLRKRVAAYAEARGYGAIDPNNLSQILDVLLQFLTKLLPLIMTFI